MTIAFRKALTGVGYVICLHSTTNRSIPLQVEITNQTFHQSKEFDVVLDAGQTREIGYLQGWSFSSGDQIQIKSGNAIPMLVAMP